MIALRCTQKVLRRLGQPAAVRAPGAPTSALGDWYINLVRVGADQLVMATSERSLLTALLPAVDLNGAIGQELCRTVHDLLLAIDVPALVAQHEVAQMSEWRIARTASRSVLGCMNDFDRMLGSYLPGRTLMHVMRQFAGTPMLTSGKGIVASLHLPSDAAFHLLGLPVPDRGRRDLL